MEISGEGMEAMSGAQLLDTADALALAAMEIDCRLLELAAQFAVVNGPDTVDPDLARLPGRQSARRFGGSGTPEVASFAPAELGARIGRSTWAGEQLIADALDLRHRLPQLWARVQKGEVRAFFSAASAAAGSAAATAPSTREVNRVQVIRPSADSTTREST